MSKVWLSILLLAMLMDSIICPPVSVKKTDEEEKDTRDDEDISFGLEYERYLKEVVGVLESDEAFRKKLQESNVSEIKMSLLEYTSILCNIFTDTLRKNNMKSEMGSSKPILFPLPTPKLEINNLSYKRYMEEVIELLIRNAQFRERFAKTKDLKKESGEIARHLEFVSHNIRTKLDEIKRKEIDRLRQVMKIQQQIKRGMPHVGLNPALLSRPSGHNDPDFPMLNKERVLAHLDHKNPHTFEVEDLAKLIKQASQDLEDIDKQRRSEFKRYEMEKEAEEREKLSKMTEEERKVELKRVEEMKKKHADHPKIHHPISKDQLEEVWEETDGMDKDDFDPRTFFALHDQNGDGVLDEAEVEALFQKELDKIYDPNNPEDDLVERYEEMNRMREHVFNEVDTNKDKLISLEEFLKSTERSDFEKDEGWDTLDEQKIYTDEELEQFVREYEERQRQELERQGHVPPVDPSHPDIIVQDHLGQDQRFHGQGQQVHMEQQPQFAQQQGGNLPNQGNDLKFQTHQPQQPMEGQPIYGQGPPIHGQGQSQNQPEGHDQPQDQVHAVPQSNELPQHPRVPTNL